MPKRPATPSSLKEFFVVTKKAREASPNSSTSPSPRNVPDNSSLDTIYERPGIVATAVSAAIVDANPPLKRLEKALENSKINTSGAEIGDAALYWMRMEDMRLRDNRALAAAAAYAKRHKLPLLVLFIFSPGDYKAHDRSPRRIDFTVRNIKVLRKHCSELHIPLYTVVQRPRSTIPEKVVALASAWNVSQVFVNFEYEVDELRRDLAVVELGAKSGVQLHMTHNKCIVEPGVITTKDGAPYSVYGHWMKNWNNRVHANEAYIKAAPPPGANDASVRTHPIYGSLFDAIPPDVIEGFECKDKEKMEHLWPAGEDAAAEVLERFLSTKARSSQVGDSSPLEPGAETVDLDASRIGAYQNDRDRCDKDTTSRISPYLAAGVISARECLRGTIRIQGKPRPDASRGTGPGVWMMEVAWRDFYTHVMAAFPRVSMGRPFQEKYAGIFWETDPDGRFLNAWKQGKTGYPIVDAAMRQMNTQGWMHNRARMITAMFLTKDLMLDWRLGERYFMQSLIDGDLASNDGGWQWSASTGTDAQPWFRIFNPVLQSEKADPSGDYIRHFVPELRKLKGKAIHDPFHNMPKDAFRRLGYPEPIVDHKIARERALRRFKNVGAE